MLNVAYLAGPFCKAGSESTSIASCASVSSKRARFRLLELLPVDEALIVDMVLERDGRETVKDRLVGSGSTSVSSASTAKQIYVRISTIYHIEADTYCFQLGP